MGVVHTRGIKLHTHSAKQPLVPKLHGYRATYQCIVFMTARRVERRGSTRCFTGPLVSERAQGSHPTQVLIKPHPPGRGYAALPIGNRCQAVHMQRRIHDPFDFHFNKRWLSGCQWPLAFASKPASLTAPRPPAPRSPAPRPPNPVAGPRAAAAATQGVCGCCRAACPPRCP